MSLLLYAKHEIKHWSNVSVDQVIIVCQFHQGQMTLNVILLETTSRDEKIIEKFVLVFRVFTLLSQS